MGKLLLFRLEHLDFLETIGHYLHDYFAFGSFDLFLGGLYSQRSDYKSDRTTNKTILTLMFIVVSFLLLLNSVDLAYKLYRVPS